MGILASVESVCLGVWLSSTTSEVRCWAAEGDVGAQTEVRSAGPAQIPCPPPLVSVSPLWFVASGLRSNRFFITSSVGHPYPSSLAESEHAVCYFISTTDTTKYDHSFAVVYFITIFLSCYFLF